MENAAQARTRSKDLVPAHNVRAKRPKLTNEMAVQLRRQIQVVLAHDHPQSSRHVFYRMTNPHLPVPVPKSDKGYRQVQQQLCMMRRKGLIPYSWIADSTRSGYHVDTFDSAADFIRSMAGHYRADAWRHARHYVEVWTESRSIAGVIMDDCEELGVSLYPAGGFTSITLPYEAAQEINASCLRSGRSAEIVYIGDLDPAGVLIDRKIEAELRKHLDPAVHLTFHRLGINPDQVVTYDLPSNPRKETDKRSRHIVETVEAEALPAHILRQLLRDAVERFMPSGALVVAKAAEKSEKDGLLALARAMDRDHRRNGLARDSQ